MLCIGLISGTSMDGVDAVLVDLAGDGPRLLASHRESYPPPTRKRLLAAAGRPGAVGLAEFGSLDVEVGLAFAEAALALLRRAGVERAAVTAIGSHGQTLYHAPLDGLRYSVQIGEPSRIVEATGIQVVARFRERDLAAGGQGAPLASALHAALFRHPSEDRAVLNLGGIANLTLLPADPDAPLLGFDTGPASALLDEWAQRHLGTPMDEGGRWAAAGEVDEALLAVLLEEPYFAHPPPKSTGRETFHLGWAAERCTLEGRRPEDVQATFAALTVRTVAGQLRRHAPGCARLLVCGGGVHNATLMAGLAAHLPGIAVESTAAHGLDPDWVEATLFAWLARRCLEGLPGNLPAVTGAAGPRVLGAVYPP